MKQIDTHIVDCPGCNEPLQLDLIVNIDDTTKSVLVEYDLDPVRESNSLGVCEWSSDCINPAVEQDSNGSE